MMAHNIMKILEKKVAEGEGFEPSIPLDMPVFKDLRYPLFQPSLYFYEFAVSQYIRGFWRFRQKSLNQQNV